MRDELSPVFKDGDFADLFPSRGQPAAAPWQLALVTVMQFAENLTDRQAADAVRARWTCPSAWTGNRPFCSKRTGSGAKGPKTPSTGWKGGFR